MVLIKPTLLNLLTWPVSFPGLWLQDNAGTYGVVVGLGLSFYLYGNPMGAYEAGDYMQLAKGYVIGGAAAYGVAATLNDNPSDYTYFLGFKSKGK